MRNVILIILLFFSSCTSLNQPDDIHAAVLKALCTHVQRSAPDRALEIVINSTTVPLLNELSAEALRFRSGTEATNTPETTALLTKYEKEQVPRRLTSPTGPTCRFAGTARPVHRDDLLLQVSNVLVNPYLPMEQGVLGRLSLGGDSGATWFWVVVRRQENEEIVSDVVELSIDDG